MIIPPSISLGRGLDNALTFGYIPNRGGIMSGSRLLRSNELARASEVIGALIAIKGELGLLHMAALLVVAARPGISVSELAAELAVPQQSASRYVATLCGRYRDQIDAEPSAPFIAQALNVTDPRTRSLFLTEAGQTFIDRVFNLAGDVRRGE
jgi:DNA-binding MarR family transcriptional regulator